MKKEKRQLGIYLRENEYQTFMEGFKGTPYRSKNAYVRNLVLGKPVKVLCRNRSLDDFIEFGVKIRKDLRLLLEKEGITAAEKRR